MSAPQYTSDVKINHDGRKAEKMDKLQKIIFWLYAVLLFFVPLILWPFTSEVFEFNKIVLTYLVATLIAGVWAVRCIVERKLIFRRTILDIPLLIFLASQTISTFLSIDVYTSLWGYYSRFNGGLVSLICYSILYWAFVSNLNAKQTLKLIKVSLASGALVAIYGVFEHFGIDKNLWVQDVQSRVFSTLGQPNWLAAYMAALIPVAWALAIKTGFKSKNFIIYFAVSILFFWVLIFTKSRSGFAGFAVATIIFWVLVFLQNLKNVGNVIAPAAAVILSLAVVCLISGTQWTPGLKSLISKSANSQAVQISSGTALETGGTESGTIRKIVWKGAVDIWKHYPIFGTGVETFAYSYYLYRPVSHNLTSEWDFIYNKAHNELLNFAANTGSIGLLSYLVLIGFSLYLILIKSGAENAYLKYGFSAGIVSLLVSNFFGFSVVPTQLELFLFPAFAAATTQQSVSDTKHPGSLSKTQKIMISLVLFSTLYLLFYVGRYWLADTLYNKGKAENSAARPDLAITNLSAASLMEPHQAIYNAELAAAYSSLAMAYDAAKDASSAAQASDLAVVQIQKAVNLAPANINIRRTLFGVYVRLSTIDEKYLTVARDSLNETIKMAPTDAKLYYNRGIANANLGETQKALEDFQKSIELKANYTDARIQYAALLVHLKQNAEAKKQLEYILTKIDPGNTTAKQALDNINQ